MRARKHVTMFDAARVGFGATDMKPSQLPEFARWLRARGYTVVSGTNGYTDEMNWCGTNGMQWQAGHETVRCRQMAHLAGPLAAEFLKETA